MNPIVRQLPNHIKGIPYCHLIQMSFIMSSIPLLNLILCIHLRFIVN